MVHGRAERGLDAAILSPSRQDYGITYIVVFGVGSIGGMMLMSALVGLPVYLTAARSNRANLAVRGMAGLFSLSFGLFMVYKIGFVEGLFR